MKQKFNITTESIRGSLANLVILVGAARRDCVAGDKDLVTTIRRAHSLRSTRCE